MSSLFFDNYIKENKPQFKAKVDSISTMLSINPDWLLSVMLLESSINPQAVNKYTNAVGLIQFMPSTATELGTTTAELYEMNNLQQLDYVYKYLSRYAGKMNSLSDVYLSVFFPAAVNKANDYILQTSSLSAAKIASQNPAFDIDKDGKVTKAEIESFLQNWLKKKRLYFPHN